MKTKLLLSAVLQITVMISYGQWSYDNLSQPKCQMGATSLGSKAYFAGGNNDFAPLSAVEIYDADYGMWDSIIHLSKARFFPACVAAGDKVFFAGGIDLYSGAACFDDVDIWNTTTKEWTTELLSFPRFALSAVSKGNKVLFAGGINPLAGTSYSVVEIYNLATLSWESAQLSEPRGTMASAVIGDLAFFAGGWNEQTGHVSNVVDIYRFSTNTWSTATLSEGRMTLAAAVTGSKVLFAGGTTDDNNPSNRVDVYDTLTKTWTIDSISEARGFWQHNAATVFGKAYFVGGGIFDIPTKSFTTAFSTIDIYDGFLDEWTVDNLTQAIFNHGVAGPECHLVVAGGVVGLTNVTSVVEIYKDPDCVNPGITGNGSKNISFSVFPNPSSGNIYINISNDSRNCLLSNVYNMQGQMVFTKALLNNDRELNLQLPAGVYVLRVVAEDRVYSELITIQ
jgi:hypothetical protein